MNFIRHNSINKRLLSKKPFLSNDFRSYISTQVRKPLLEKILIANRGEIACRVMKTAKKLGIKTVGVYSEADEKSLHVQMADEAYCIGPAASSESYLDMKKIISIAKLSNSQGIHPGYGFLSENADFAEKLEDIGISFIGPPASAIRSMGSKSESKKIMEEANVPVVPGYHGDNQSIDNLKAEALKIKYPILIKAVKGGGGKGMRVVEKEEDFEMMLDSAKREAIKSFGDDKVLIEKYIEAPRHVEVQVFADKHGNAVYLFERDCSVQRRHQKILEESPAPNLSEETRRTLGEKAVSAAKAVGYVGAGTVEFIMDSKTNEFFFMEMNTRLQVEHPVTEMVTGTDLVEWQIEVASGNELLLEQNELKLSGHAFEARIYAENPENQFLPDIGKLLHYSTPNETSDIRVETGVREGDEISVYYDPMIAKLVVHGANRDSALRVLDRSLHKFEISGLHTNINFLRKVISNEDFKKGLVETGFIKNHENELLHSLSPPNIKDIAQSGLAIYLNNISFDKDHKPDSSSPWELYDGFQIGSTNKTFYTTKLNYNSFDYDVSIEIGSKRKDQYKVTVMDQATSIERVFDLSVANKQKIVSETQSGEKTKVSKIVLRCDVNGEMCSSTVVLNRESLSFFGKDGKIDLKINDSAEELLNLNDVGNKAGSIVAPMSSKISQIMVSPGTEVDIGTPLVILEAMKMEHVIRSPKKGVISKVNYTIGELVSQGDKLVAFEE
ncbi:hypothetical protein BB559_005028 [Furculomyces boomerangus]|uniref:Methylcrotonoyl-CoA carboxylase subunit alpha, mitochondrial n=2 Tax=Harpellales TaxID=61421 RepID=A0A2T9YB92_9FUNG|nr:hypothetical protein BB559_005028 [Furculomyces boomerangus]PVZ96822.1 hypothetical protein BB558_007243 [Smittium angustum]